MTTTVYFDDIQNVICKELLQAKRSIYVAVAWFTDLLLFETLLKLQEKNVYIQLIIIDDEINFKNYSLPFEKLRNSSGSFLAVKNDKMHHKFCIIDEDVVITGSYNWTYKAATGNKNENIQISKGHSELTYKFIREFYRILLQNQEDKIEVIDEIPVGEIVDKLSKVHRNRSGIPYV